MKSQELTPQEILIAEGIASRAQNLQEQLLEQDADQTQVLALITTAGAKALSRIDDIEVSGLVMNHLITALASSNVSIMVRNQLAMTNKELETQLEALYQQQAIDEAKEHPEPEQILDDLASLGEVSNMEG